MKATVLSVFGVLLSIGCKAGGEERIESVTLRKEMIEVLATVMQIQEPDSDAGEIREMAEKMIGPGIVELRKHDGGFLMVSPENEKKLRGGIPIESSAKRIVEGEELLKEFGAPLSAVCVWLLPKYKEGELKPARTELLAQLLVAEARKLMDALEK